MEFEWGLITLPENAVVVLEEALGSTNVTYALQLAAGAAGQGKRVTYITPQYRDDVRTQMDLYRIKYFDRFEIPECARTTAAITTSCTGDFCVIDQFASFCPDADLARLKTTLCALIDASRNGRTILLTMTTGILSDRHEQLIRSLADGVIQFLEVNEGGKIKRYLNVPKMKGELPPERMAPFSVTEEGILIDTRERHG
ncbi:MAG: hypothetical protein PHR49_01345 [Methanoculleus sp.]|nr:hypothetical protein [Methanoculleus sp.]